MNKCEELISSLQKEGYEFSIFLKDEKSVDNPDDNKFSAAFVTPAAERLLPQSIWESVDRDTVRSYGNEYSGKKYDFDSVRINLNNSQAVGSYVERALKLLRQVLCKMIAKVWIKMIEPKKKTRYPYIKRGLTKPYWWPYNVEHKEPDHLRKLDRLKLLCTIIIDVIPQRGDFKLFQRIKDATFGLPLLKNDIEKRNIISSVFNISLNLLSQIPRNIEYIEVMKLGSSQVDGCQCNDIAVRTSTEGLGERKTSSKQEEDFILETGYSESKLKKSDIENLSGWVLLDLLVQNDPDLQHFKGIFEESSL